MTSSYPGVHLDGRSTAGMQLWTQSVEAGSTTRALDQTAGLLPPTRTPAPADGGARAPPPTGATPVTDETALRAGASRAELDVKQQTWMSRV